MTLVEQLAQEISIISGLPTVLVMDKAQIIIQELHLVQLAESQNIKPLLAAIFISFHIIAPNLVIELEKALKKEGWRKVILEEH